MKVRIWVVGDRTPLDFEEVDAVVLEDGPPLLGGKTPAQELRDGLALGRRVLFVNPDALVALEASP